MRQASAIAKCHVLPTRPSLKVNTKLTSWSNLRGMRTISASVGADPMFSHHLVYYGLHHPDDLPPVPSSGRLRHKKIISKNHDRFGLHFRSSHLPIQSQYTFFASNSVNDLAIGHIRGNRSLIGRDTSRDQSESGFLMKRLAMIIGYFLVPGERQGSKLQYRTWRNLFIPGMVLSIIRHKSIVDEPRNVLNALLSS